MCQAVRGTTPNNTVPDVVSVSPDPLPPQFGCSVPRVVGADADANDRSAFVRCQSLQRPLERLRHVLSKVWCGSGGLNQGLQVRILWQSELRLTISMVKRVAFSPPTRHIGPEASQYRYRLGVAICRWQTYSTNAPSLSSQVVYHGLLTRHRLSLDGRPRGRMLCGKRHTALCR